MPLLPDGFGFLIGYLLSLRAHFLEALFYDGDAELVQHPLCAFVFPPVEALEDAGLRPFAGIILENHEFRLFKFALDAQPLADFSGLIQVIWRNRLDAFGAQIAADLPVPHRHRAKLRGDDQQWQCNRFDIIQLSIGVTQHLRKDHRFGFRQRCA